MPRQLNSWSTCLTSIGSSLLNLSCILPGGHGLCGRGSRSGTIGLDEFVGLWGYLNQWRNLFTRFDADNSGAIDRKEFATALQQFGYRLSDAFVGVLFTSYDKKGNIPMIQLPLYAFVSLTDAFTACSRFANFSWTGNGQMGFDMFVQSMVTVKTLTDVFKE